MVWINFLTLEQTMTILYVTVVILGVILPKGGVQMVALDLEELRALPLGERVRLLREARGLSMSDLARLTGYSLSYISRIEKGERTRISAPAAQRLAQVLGVDVAVILGEAAPPVINPYAEVRGHLDAVKSLIPPAFPVRLDPEGADVGYLWVPMVGFEPDFGGYWLKRGRWHYLLLPFVQGEPRLFLTNGRAYIGSRPPEGGRDLGRLAASLFIPEGAGATP
jgi:transcriptional regulator with XRE-family HTH domain